MNKGRIHREWKYFQRTLWKLIKSNTELRWEIRDFYRFRKRTQRRIHRIKNHSIWIKIHGEIKRQKSDRKSIIKREKSKIKSKINLIYNSKLKLNDTWQKIRRKTHNLTHDSTWNDPIDRRIKAFYSAISKTIVEIQEANSPYSFDKISLSTTPWTQKWV